MVSLFFWNLCSLVTQLFWGIGRERPVDEIYQTSWMAVLIHADRSAIMIWSTFLWHVYIIGLGKISSLNSSQVHLVLSSSYYFVVGMAAAYISNRQHLPVSSSVSVHYLCSRTPIQLRARGCHSQNPCAPSRLMRCFSGLCCAASLSALARLSSFALPGMSFLLEKKEKIWLSPKTKAPTPTEKSEKQHDNTKTPSKTSIIQRLRTDLGRSIGATISTASYLFHYSLRDPLYVSTNSLKLNVYFNICDKIKLLK